ncbi:MAG: AAA family ATPase, partial [Halobacteriota archaeon]
WAVRQATVEALGAIYPAIISRGDNANVGALEGALHDRSWVVRKATARALGNVYGALIKQGREVDSRTLESALSEPIGAIRQASVQAIGHICEQLIEQGREVDLTPVVQRLADSDAEVRQAAVEALGEVYPRLIQARASPNMALLEALSEDEDAASRKAILRALGNVYGALIEQGREVDLTPVVQRLADSDAEVRQAAVEALGAICLRKVDASIGDDVLLQALQRTLDDESPEVRAAARHLLCTVSHTVLLNPQGELAGVMKGVGRELNASLSSPLSGTYSSFVRLSAHSLQIGPLAITRGNARVPSRPCVMTRSAYAMLKTIGLASLLGHPLLLLGPTSTGKSFLIKWLAEALGFAHVSYTMNPYISKSELIGGIKPTRQGTFTWQDGIILTAAKKGTWLVLEEINLATSEVLEILNDYLITGKFIYSENGEQRLVEPSDGFRLYATANPLSYAQRERLSQVFLSRFKVCYQEDLSEEDLIEILSELFSIPAHLAYSIAFFHVTLQEQAESKIIGNEEKEPYIFSLRDIIRLGQRLAVHGGEHLEDADLLRVLAIELCDVYLARIRDLNEKDALIKLIDTLFGLKAQDIEIGKLLKAHEEQYESLLPSLHVTSGGHLIPGDEARIIPTPTQANTLAHVLKALVFSEPILLVGYPASGKTALVRYLARTKETDLYYVNLSSDSGLEELLGGFMQDRAGRWRYQRGLLFAAIDEGAWLMIDEANLNPLSEYLNTLIDFGYATDEEGTLFHTHPNFRLFFLINPPKVHPSRNVLSPALRTRFNEIWVEETRDVEELSGLVKQWKTSSLSSE